MVRAPPLPPWAIALLTSASIASMASAVTVMGWVGQPVTLPCLYSVGRPSEVNPVCWGRGACPMSQCSDSLILTDQTRVTWRKHERYQLQGALTSGDVSLTIMDANEGDSGTYCCRIDVPGWFNDVKNNIVLKMRRAPTTTTTTTTTIKTTPVPTTTTTTTTTTATTTTTELITTEAPTTTSVPTTIEQTTLSTIITTITPTTISVPTTMEQTTLSRIITNISPTADVITPTTFTTAITTTLTPTPIISTISDTTPIMVRTTTPTIAPAISPATEPKTTSITTPETTDTNALSSTSINASTSQMTNGMKHTPTNIPSTMYITKATSTIINVQTVTDLTTASTSAPTIVSSATADINIPTAHNITPSISIKAPTSATPSITSSTNTQTTTVIPIISSGAPTTERGLTMTMHSMVSNASGTAPAFNFTKTPAPLTSFITTAVMTPGNITPVITDINEPHATRTSNTSNTTRVINSTVPLPPTEMTDPLSSDDTEKAMTPTERPDSWTMEPADITTEYSTETSIFKTNESSLGDQMPIKSTSLLSSSSLIAVVCCSVALCVLILLFGLRVRSKIWNKYHLDKTERFWADGRPAEMFNGTLQERDETENIFTL